MDKIAKEVLSELEHFASLKFGDYWNTTTRRPEPPTLATRVRRTVWYTGESRDTTLAYAGSLQDRAFLTLDNLVNESRRMGENYTGLLNSILYAILRMQNALYNLKGKYHDDTDIRTQIDDLIDRVRTRYSDFTQLHDCGIPYQPPPIADLPAPPK